MPRDPQRIDRIATLLKIVWKKHPDLRLGQLILVTPALAGAGEGLNVFHVEDDDMEQYLEKLLEE